MAKKLTMAQKRALVKKRKNTFKETVHIAACFEREKPVAGNQADYDVQLIYSDSQGCIIAREFCGDTAFVCTAEELPALISFLQKIADAKKE